MTAYYNEIEPYAAQWLRELIRQGFIPDGDVDERNIVAVEPSDLRGFDQCHFLRRYRRMGIRAASRKLERADLDRLLSMSFL